MGSALAAGATMEKSDGGNPRENLCSNPDDVGNCSGTILPALLRAARLSSSRNDSSGPLRPDPGADPTDDTLLYIAVAVVFYAVVITFLVVATFRPSKPILHREDFEDDFWSELHINKRFVWPSLESKHWDDVRYSVLGNLNQNLKKVAT